MHVPGYNIWSIRVTSGGNRRSGSRPVPRLQPRHDEGQTQPRPRGASGVRILRLFRDVHGHDGWRVRRMLAAWLVVRFARLPFRIPFPFCHTLRKRVDQDVVWRGWRERLTRHGPHTIGAHGCKPCRIPQNASKISCLNSMLRRVLCGASWRDVLACAKRHGSRP